MRWVWQGVYRKLVGNSMRKLVFVLSLLLMACGKEKPSALNKPEAIQKYEREVVLQGSVSLDGAVLKSGKVEARLPTGALLAEERLENSSRYHLTIPAGTVLPIILSYSPSESTQDGEKLISVVVQTSLYKYDINSLTTKIAARAMALGGYTSKNMIQAAADSVNVPDANKTTTGFRGDPTTQYGGWH